MGLDGVKFGDLRSLEAQSIHAEANADSIEVTGERTIFSEFCELSEAFEECFLSHILSFVAISEKVASGANHSRPVAGDECTKGNFVPLATTGNPLALLRSVVNGR